ncbi:hypothetical protein [Halosimplex halobium]|uniref:hypothetical protein n=1 Tax=Halosimplex halobium TaxID=3396618 RepID=UPI003F5728EC
MEHVIEVENGDAQVLTETGSGGLIGRGLLHDRPLAEYVEPSETPRFVVRNKKRGFTVERTEEEANDAGDAERRVANAGTEQGVANGDDAVDTGQVAPDGDHSAAALVTDTRVLFAAGRAGGDRTRSVPLADVVDARTEAGLLNEALVVDLVSGAQYRFPSRGDLTEVREFVDAAAGIWSRAERHLESAAETLDRIERAFEAGDVDVVLAAVGDVRETLDDAREAAAPLDGAAASIADRAEDCRARLAAVERRAYAEQAEQARERGHTRWDDHAYEAAADHFERAADSYAAALSVDADRPGDELIERRRANLATERERLAAAPLERAEQAVEVARGADDLETAEAWWERALERYEQVRSLDWGRDEPRFEGDREAVRERLATVARQLVEVRCERARGALDAAEEAPPGAAAAACERAETALDAARSVARERVPDALDAVEALDERLADCRPDPDDDHEVSDAGTVVVSPGEDGRDADADGADGAGPAADADEDGTASGGTDAATAEADDASAAMGDGWMLADDGGDDEWLSAERTGTAGDAAGTTDTDTTGGDADAADTDATSQPLDADAGADTTDAERVADAVADTADAEVVADAAESADTVLGNGAEKADGAAEPRDTSGCTTRGGSDGDPGSGASNGWTPAALAALGAEAFGETVADCLRAAGWSADAIDDGAVDNAADDGAVDGDDAAAGPDLRATPPGPVGVCVGVLTVPADDASTLDGDAVDRLAAAVERDERLDAAVLVAGAAPPPAVRERAAETGVDVVEPDALVEELGGSEVPAPDDEADADRE